MEPLTNPDPAPNLTPPSSEPPAAASPPPRRSADPLPESASGVVLKLFDGPQKQYGFLHAPEFPHNVYFRLNSWKGEDRPAVGDPVRFAPVRVRDGKVQASSVWPDAEPLPAEVIAAPAEVPAAVPAVAPAEAAANVTASAALLPPAPDDAGTPPLAEQAPAEQFPTEQAPTEQAPAEQPAEQPAAHAPLREADLPESALGVILKVIDLYKPYGFIQAPAFPGNVYFRLTSWKGEGRPAVGDRVRFTPVRVKDGKVQASSVWPAPEPLPAEPDAEAAPAAGSDQSSAAGAAQSSAAGPDQSSAAGAAREQILAAILASQPAESDEGIDGSDELFAVAAAHVDALHHPRVFAPEPPGSEPPDSDAVTDAAESPESIERAMLAMLDELRHAEAPLLPPETLAAEADDAPADADVPLVPPPAEPAPTYEAPPKPAPRPQPKVAVRQQAAVEPIPPALMEWAYMPRDKWLQTLVDRAMDEPWRYGSDSDHPARPLPILYNYLVNTFTRLVHEGKIARNREGTLAAFNTGLVDRLLHQPIYALFVERNVAAFKQKWALQGFCTEGEGSILSTHLVEAFQPRPQRACYIDDPSLLFYDYREGPPVVEWRHVLLERSYRFPLPILESFAPRGFAWHDPAPMPHVKRMRFHAQYSSALQSDDATLRKLQRVVREAMELTLRRLEWEIHAAVPGYYSRGNRVSLLFPLSILSERRVDCVLVVDRMPSGAYIASTVLSLRQAYNHARIVSRPVVDWLDPTQMTEPDFEPDVPTAVPSLRPSANSGL